MPTYIGSNGGSNSGSNSQKEHLDVRELTTLLEQKNFTSAIVAIHKIAPTLHLRKQFLVAVFMAACTGNKVEFVLPSSKSKSSIILVKKMKKLLATESKKAQQLTNLGKNKQKVIVKRITYRIAGKKLIDYSAELANEGYGLFAIAAFMLAQPDIPIDHAPIKGESWLGLAASFAPPMFALLLRERGAKLTYDSAGRSPHELALLRWNKVMQAHWDEISKLKAEKKSQDATEVEKIVGIVSSLNAVERMFAHQIAALFDPKVFGSPSQGRSQKVIRSEPYSLPSPIGRMFETPLEQIMSIIGYHGGKSCASPYAYACMSNDLFSLREFKGWEYGFWATPDGITPLMMSACSSLFFKKGQNEGPYNGHRYAVQDNLTRLRTQPRNSHEHLKLKIGVYDALGLAIKSGAFAMAYLIQDTGLRVDANSQVFTEPFEGWILDGVLTVTSAPSPLEIVEGMKIIYGPVPDIEDREFYQRPAQSTIVLKVLDNSTYLVDQDTPYEGKMFGAICSADLLELIAISFKRQTMGLAHATFPWGKPTAMTLITVMRAMPKSKIIGKSGTQIFYDMFQEALDNGKGMGQAILKEEIIVQSVRTIANVCYMMSQDTEVTMIGFKALNALLSAPEEISKIALKTAIEKGVINVYFQALRFSRNNVVHPIACKVINKLLSLYDSIKSPITELIKADSASHIYQAIHWHSNCPEVVTNALEALLRLTDPSVTVEKQGDISEAIIDLYEMLINYIENKQIMSLLTKLICNIVQTNKNVWEDVGNTGKLERFTFVLTFYRKKAEENLTEESAEVCTEVVRAISLLTQNAPQHVSNAITAGLLKAMEDLRKVIGPQFTALRMQVDAVIWDFKEQVANYKPPVLVSPSSQEENKMEKKAPEGAPPPLKLTLQLHSGKKFRKNTELAIAHRKACAEAESLKKEEAEVEGKTDCETEAKTLVETTENKKGLLKNSVRVEWTSSPSFIMEETNASKINFEEAAQNGQKKYDEISATVEKRLTIAPTKKSVSKRIEFGPDQVREISPRVKADDPPSSDFDEKTPIPSAYYQESETPCASDYEAKTPGV